MTAYTKTFIGIAALALCIAAAAADAAQPGSKPAPAAPATRAAPAAPPTSVAAAASGTGQPLTITLSDPASPATLRVGLIMGNITVRGTNRKDVLIETMTHDGEDVVMANRPDPAAAKGLRKISQSAGFSAEEHDNRIDVRNNAMHQSVDLVIEVPARTNLNLSTVNDGDVRVENVDGEMEIGNVNGQIVLQGVGGAIVAHTVNGELQAKLTRVATDKSLAFTTLNGEVDVTLPAATKASLRLRSDNGDVYSDFDLQMDSSATAPTVNDERRNRGRYRIEVNKMIRGTINGGGADVEIRTFNGNVYVRKGS